MERPSGGSSEDDWDQGWVHEASTAATMEAKDDQRQETQDGEQMAQREAHMQCSTVAEIQGTGPACGCALDSYTQTAVATGATGGLVMRMLVDNVLAPKTAVRYNHVLFIPQRDADLQFFLVHIALFRRFF
ncbi:hypothetical protein NDU88_004797 [Pleurodeles waltl]|uniref:Uncharacterized protein n=1 Tax=Pleurodeles waltl TaxID=8319 RepID=A0AAV7VLS1_PLEWA|nr:hypothetical protein NDU88_004797 [Pleurodeles waltl]